jgi:hypothetical protein
MILPCPRKPPFLTIITPRSIAATRISWSIRFQSDRLTTQRSPKTLFKIRYISRAHVKPNR